MTAAFRLLFQRSAHAGSYRCSVPPKACSRRCGSPQAAAARSPCMRRASACACRPLALAHSSCCCCTGPHSGPWPSVQKRGTPAHSMALHGAGDAFGRNSTAHPVAPHPPACALRSGAWLCRLALCWPPAPIAVVFRCVETAFSAMVTLPQLWSVENGALVGSGRPTAVIPQDPCDGTRGLRSAYTVAQHVSCGRRSVWREARRAIADAMYRTALPRRSGTAAALAVQPAAWQKHSRLAWFRVPRCAGCVRRTEVPSRRVGSASHLPGSHCAPPLHRRKTDDRAARDKPCRVGFANAPPRIAFGVRPLHRAPAALGSTDWWDSSAMHWLAGGHD